jgi:hypothetical protein
MMSENFDTTFGVKMADIVITDDGVGTNDLTLSGDDAGLFEIVGNELWLKAGTTLDHEANPVLDVTVEVDDAAVGATPDDIASLSATVTDVNEAPTDLALDNASVAENSPGAVVGNVSVTDPDAGDSHTFTVDDARFEVVGGQLKLKAGQSLDHEAEPTVTVTVTATDSGGLTYNEAFTINVNDVNENPIVDVGGLPPEMGEPPPDTTEPHDEPSDSGDEGDASEEESAEGDVGMGPPPDDARPERLRGDQGGAIEQDGEAVVLAGPFEVAETGNLRQEQNASEEVWSYVSQDRAVQGGISRVAAGLATALGAPYQSHVAMGLVWNDLAELQNQVQLFSASQDWDTGSALAMSTALSVGYVAWAARGSYLVASLLAQMPAWQLVDPLPVLECIAGGAGAAGSLKDEDDEESLETIVEGTAVGD